MMKQILLFAVFFLMLCAAVQAQIYRVAQMNTDQIRVLDKQKTVVILTGGILEQHGPHLPSYSDGYVNEWRSERLAEAITERPGWAALMFPTIPLGSGGANEIGDKYVFPGTYAVRWSTVRAVYMDLATELGEQGFRWVVVMHGHGAPHNNLALEQAGEYFRDTYGGRMVHLVGLRPTQEQYAKAKLTVPYPELTEAEAKENGPDIHAGFDETSGMLFLRPDLVNPIYKQLPPLAVNNPADQYKIANAKDWLGYLGSPRLGNASFGSRKMHCRAAQAKAIVWAIIDGVLDERDIPRYSKPMFDNKDVVKSLEGAIKDDAERTRKQREWMKKKGVE
jgi:creatinine amidohydrolase/Fe(II)-dependent formamide hydrolase-like protein